MKMLMKQRKSRVRMHATRGVAATLLLLLITWSALAADLRLVEATQKQDRVAIAALLKSGADVSAAQPDGATALHWAAQWNDLATAEQLIRAGTNANAANAYGVRPLSIACLN